MHKGSKVQSLQDWRPGATPRPDTGREAAADTGLDTGLDTGQGYPAVRVSKINDENA